MEADMATFSNESSAILRRMLPALQCKPSAQTGDSCHWPRARAAGKLATVESPPLPVPASTETAESDFRQLGSVNLAGHTLRPAPSGY